MSKWLLLCCLPALLLGGCSSNYTVVDLSGMTFNLKNVHMTGGDEFEVLDGEALRVIPMKRVAKIVLDPSKTYYRNNQLFYYAYLELLDGTKIKPRQSGGETTKSYVNIRNTITGMAPNGYVELPLENVNVISQTLAK